MKLERLGSRQCAGDICPAVYRTDQNTVVVCGQPVTTEAGHAPTLGAGEVAVEIPEALLLEAARALAKA